jgi:hypothetical protein
MSDTPITDAAILSWAEFTDEGYGPSKYVHVDDMRALERDLIKAKQAISDTHRAGHILAMELLQSGAWDRLDDEARAAADCFLPKSLKAPEAPK